jgi:hypothetical protein
MSHDEFKKYMAEQVNEINKYRKLKTKKNKNVDENKCAFEWIDNYAKKFSEKWRKKTD